MNRQLSHAIEKASDTLEGRKTKRLNYVDKAAVESILSNPKAQINKIQTQKQKILHDIYEQKHDLIDPNQIEKRTAEFEQAQDKIKIYQDENGLYYQDSNGIHRTTIDDILIFALNCDSLGNQTRTWLSKNIPGNPDTEWSVSFKKDLFTKMCLLLYTSEEVTQMWSQIEASGIL